MKKYEEIADELRRRIADGEYAEGEMLRTRLLWRKNSASAG